MDWVRRPHVGGPLAASTAAPTRPWRTPAPLRGAPSGRPRAPWSGLDIDGALRLPPLPGLRRAAARPSTCPRSPTPSRAWPPSAGQLASRRAHLRQMATYRTNLEYLMGRIDPDAHPMRSRPRPLPGVAPDQLRVLTRRPVPHSVRHAVMDWSS